MNSLKIYVFIIDISMANLYDVFVLIPSVQDYSIVVTLLIPFKTNITVSLRI